MIGGMAKPTEPAGGESLPTLYDVVRINVDGSRHVVLPDLSHASAMQLLWALFRSNPDRDYILVRSG